MPPDGIKTLFLFYIVKNLKISTILIINIGKALRIVPGRVSTQDFFSLNVKSLITDFHGLNLVLLPSIKF